MYGQAAALALVAAISPTAMLISVLYLASPRPARTTGSFVLGGLLAVAIVGAAALIAIRAGGLSLGSHRTPRYGLRLGLGVLALTAAAVILRRKPKPPDPSKAKKPGLIARLTADPKPGSAFVVGAMIFAVSGSFLAAVQVVATAKAGPTATAVAMIMIFALTIALAWVPLVAYLIAPEPTTRTLQAINAWIAKHSRGLLAAALGVIGVVLVVQGVAGVT